MVGLKTVTYAHISQKIELGTQKKEKTKDSSQVSFMRKTVSQSDYWLNIKINDVVSWSLNVPAIGEVYVKTVQNSNFL